MKKLRIVLAVVLIINMLSVITFASEAESAVDLTSKFLSYGNTAYIEETAAEEVSEQKVYCTTTSNDEFELGEIIVVLSKEQSAVKQGYSSEDFQEINVMDVGVLYDYYPEDENNIILVLTISEI